MSLGDRIRVQPAAAATRDATRERAPRGRVWLYAIAFGMLLIAGWLQVKGNLHSRLRLVWWSIGLSIAAALVALASVLVPGRRLRTSPAGATASTATVVQTAESEESEPEPEEPTDDSEESEPEPEEQTDDTGESEPDGDAKPGSSAE